MCARRTISSASSPRPQVRDVVALDLKHARAPFAERPVVVDDQDADRVRSSTEILRVRARLLLSSLNGNLRLQWIRRREPLRRHEEAVFVVPRLHCRCSVIVETTQQDWCTLGAMDKLPLQDWLSSLDRWDSDNSRMIGSSHRRTRTWRGRARFGAQLQRTVHNT